MKTFECFGVQPSKQMQLFPTGMNYGKDFPPSQRLVVYIARTTGPTSPPSVNSNQSLLFFKSIIESNP